MNDDNPFKQFVKRMDDMGVTVTSVEVGGETFNPFLESPAPSQEPNPFLLPSQQPSTSTEVEPAKKYSSDPKERYQQLVAEGKIGPQYGKLGGGRKKQHETAAKAVRELAAEYAEEIAQVFLDGIDEKHAIGIRMHAAEKLLKIEGEQVDRERAIEAADFEKQSKEQLAGNILSMLEDIAEAGILAREVMQLREGEIVDADVVDEQ